MRSSKIVLNQSQYKIFTYFKTLTISISKSFRVLLRLPSHLSLYWGQEVTHQKTLLISVDVAKKNELVNRDTSIKQRKTCLNLKI